MVEIKQIKIFDTIFGELIEKYDPKISSIKTYGVLDENGKCDDPYFVGNDVMIYLKGEKANTYRLLKKFKKDREIVIKKVLIPRNSYNKIIHTPLGTNMLTKYGMLSALSLCKDKSRSHICFRELIHKLFDNINDDTKKEYHEEMETPEIQSELENADIEDPGLVYFIKNMETNRVKIGRTTDIESRLTSLQVCNDCELKVVKTIPCTSDYPSEKLESYIHDIFQAQHIRGEWFKLTDEQLNQEIIVV